MKLKTFIYIAFMAVCLFFSFWVKTELHSWLGYAMIASVALLCGECLYFIIKESKNGESKQA